MKEGYSLKLYPFSHAEVLHSGTFRTKGILSDIVNRGYFGIDASKTAQKGRSAKGSVFGGKRKRRK